MDYTLDFACDDREPLQRELNALYRYGDDLATKVLHRARLNLFTLLARDLDRRGLLARRDAALDVGCNAGYYSHLISGLGYARVLGIDVVPDMIDTASKAFSRPGPDRVVEFRLEPAEALPPEPRYDFVLCTEVIEHTQDPDRVIATLAALLAPGGVLIVSLPNRWSLPYVVARLTRRLKRLPRDEDFERHQEFPCARTLRLFTGADRRLVASSGTNLIWDDRLLHAAHGTPWFAAVNRAQFELGRRAPLKFATQFFYVAVRRDGGA